MKRVTTALLIVLMINLLGSFVYAGPTDFPRPNSDEPITTTTEMPLD